MKPGDRVEYFNSGLQNQGNASQYYGRIGTVASVNPSTLFVLFDGDETGICLSRCNFRQAVKLRYLVVYDNADGYTDTYRTDDPNDAENRGKQKASGEFTIYIVTKAVKYTPIWKDEVVT